MGFLLFHSRSQFDKKRGIAMVVNSVYSEKDTVFAAVKRVSEKYNLDTTELYKKIASLEESSIYEHSLTFALNQISMSDPNWTFLAANLYLGELYRIASNNRGYKSDINYGDFYTLIAELTRIGIYSKDLLQDYTKEEIEILAGEIAPERDFLFNYIGLFLLADRYLAKDYEGNLYELPQERFMIIAMTLMRKEQKEVRLTHVKEAYWALSNLYMTVATPTLSNAGKSFGQLSSCFIDTVEDSLDGIYLNNWDIARLSKDGGGLCL
jgi:ribonucleoside-diphosphate reductase alpha chain